MVSTINLIFIFSFILALLLLLYVYINQKIINYNPNKSEQYLQNESIKSVESEGKKQFVNESFEINKFTSSLWFNVSMPNKSYFAGFSKPQNTTKWIECQYQAYLGDQVLLRRVLESIKTPFNLVVGDKSYRWTHVKSDVHVSANSGWLDKLINYTSHRAPITLFGFKEYSKKYYLGKEKAFHGLNPDQIVNNKDFNIPRQIVGIGSMDENWGWLSSYFLNRSVTWGFGVSGESNPYNKNYKYMQESLQSFLDDPNLIMFMVNQFHNITHHKVISYPLGIQDPNELWKSYNNFKNNNTLKTHLLFSAGSNWAFRPKIRRCVSEKMGNLFIVRNRLKLQEYHLNLMKSFAVLCMPGLGYDTYRLWETLACGAMPVIERNAGLDRSVYRLPVLIVDDFYDINPTILREAYVEALYRADDWEFNRLKQKYWENLLFEASRANSSEVLQRLHPMSAIDTEFTRPLVPFDCDTMGGCGNGTKRVPKKSCAIDPSVMSESYNWIWDHSINDNDNSY